MKAEKSITDLKANAKELESNEEVLAGVIDKFIEAADTNKENIEFDDKIMPVTAVDDNTGVFLPENEEDFTSPVVIDNRKR